MMGRSNFLWALAANILNAGLWAAIIPISSHYLGIADTALWLNFVVLASVGQLLELGFNPTLARSYSYVLAGAQSLKAVGVEQAHGPVNKRLLAELIYASKKIYLAVGLLSAIVLWGGGALYLISVVPIGVSPDRVVIDWCIYSLGNIAALWFGYTNSMIIGRGDVKFYNQVLVLTRSIQLVLSVGGLVAGGGLLLLSLASLISALIGRLVSYRRVRADILETHELLPSADSVSALVRVLWHNSGRYGLVMVGAFLITRANLLIAGAIIGVVPAAGYNFSVQVLSFLQSLAAVPFNLNLPKLNALWARQHSEATRDMFGLSLVSGGILFMIGAATFVAAGPLILSKIKGSLVLPQTSLLVLMSLAFLLELNHGVCANLLTIANKVPFVSASLLTGVAIVTVSWFVAPHFGVLGLIVTAAGLQLLYNNWKWPILATRMLNVGYFRLVADGFFVMNRKFSRKLTP